MKKKYYSETTTKIFDVMNNKNKYPENAKKKKKHSFLLRIVFNEYLINEIKGAFRNQTYFVVVSAWNFSSELMLQTTFAK
jgi:hypothetical protein